MIAENDSDQVVVPTLADLFDVKKALSKANSAQLVGSMSAENLWYLTEKRYGSRFGTLVAESNPCTTSSPAAFKAQKSNIADALLAGNHEQSPGPRDRRDRPIPNEMRKRHADGTVDEEKDRTAAK